MSANDSTLSDMLISLEKKYQTQLNDMADTNQKYCQELEEKNKKLEKSLK